MIRKKNTLRAEVVAVGKRLNVGAVDAAVGVVNENVVDVAGFVTEKPNDEPAVDVVPP